jgi:vacuolar-type H+-ATPase subunit H
MSLEPLLNEIEILKVEYEKFERGNKSAGTRARKSLQNIKKAAQDLRNEIQDSKKEEGSEEA